MVDYLKKDILCFSCVLTFGFDVNVVVVIETIIDWGGTTSMKYSLHSLPPRE